MFLKKLLDELKRRNVIKSTLGYLITSWVILQVMALLLPTIEAPKFILKLILLILVFGFPVWLLFSWKYEFTIEGIKKTTPETESVSSRTTLRLAKAIFISLSLMASLFLYWQISTLMDPRSPMNDLAVTEQTTPTDGKSIAVLPFSNLSSDAQQDYFCDGISEDIINNLTQLTGIHVVARTSSFAFKDRNLDVREIGEMLNAKNIIEGSVMKSGTNLRITVKLINVENGYNLWSEQYDRELKDIFSIQKEISRNIVNALEINLGSNEKLAGESTNNVQAYDLYLRGRDYFHQAHHDKIILSIAMFKKAIEKDAKYALAYSGLADSYSYLYIYFDHVKENLSQALLASKQAVILDPDLAEAHASRGIALSQNSQFNLAEKEFEKAIELSPKLFEAYYEFGRIAIMQGNHKKASILLEKAIEIRPEDYEANIFLVSTYQNLNMDSKMETANLRTLQVLRNHLDLYPDDSRALYLGAGSLVRANRLEEAAKWISMAVALQPEEIVVLYNAACIYALLGKHDTALDYFERTIDAGYASRDWIKNDSDFDAIRNHPRFLKALNKIN